MIEASISHIFGSEDKRIRDEATLLVDSNNMQVDCEFVVYVVA